MPLVRCTLPFCHPRAFLTLLSQRLPRHTLDEAMGKYAVAALQEGRGAELPWRKLSFVVNKEQGGRLKGVHRIFAIVG